MSVEQSSGRPQTPPYPEYKPPIRKPFRWWIPLLIIGVLFAGFVFVIGMFYLVVQGSFEQETVTVESHSVLELRLPNVLGEIAETNPLAFLSSSGKHEVNFLDALNALERARDDDNIVGLYYRTGSLRTGFSKAVELREAIEDFKSSGKFVYAFIETGGEMDYFLASAADSVFMAAEGIIELNGFGISSGFMKGTLEKLGIDYHVVQFEEYKGAAETIDREGFSAENREQLRAIVDQRFRIFVTTIADSRGIAEQRVVDALDRGVYTSDTLLALNLIDAVRSESLVRESMKQLSNAGANGNDRDFRKVSLRRYVNSAWDRSVENVSEDVEIAIVYGSGAIVTGESDEGGFGGNQEIASQTFIKHLREARENDNVDAVLLRVDSPGGSAVASDAIWEEIQLTRQEKPVYCSMSDLAASGGYYIGMACDSIFAHPSTLTGSIGVIMAIPNLSELFDNIDMNFDTLSTGEAALFMDPSRPFRDKDMAKLRILGEGMYHRFVRRVAEARNKDFEATRALAKGRVWTGEAALQHGLIDGLADFKESIEIVKRSLGVAEGQKVRLHVYPRRVDPFEAFLKLFDPESSASLSAVAQQLAAERQETLLSQFSPLWEMLPQSLRRQLGYLMTINRIASKERSMMAMPFLPLVQ